MRSPSSGWRKTSRTWRRNSGHASKKSTPLWASDTSPGIGTWPTADQPRIRDGVVLRAKWSGRDQRRTVTGEAGDTVDAGGVEGFGGVMANRMGVRRRANIDRPDLRGPSMSR
jgi:hypothetical protein